MSNRLKWMISLLLLTTGTLAMFSQFYRPSVAQVLPGQRAVLSEGGEVTRILEPGLHTYNLARTEIAIYNVAFEREHLIPEAGRVEDCAVGAAIHYNISDVLAFHVSGGNEAMFSELDAELSAALDETPLQLDTQFYDQVAALRDHFNTLAPAGVNIVRVTLDLGACEARLPRFVEGRVAPVDLVPGTGLATNRISLPSVSLGTAEGMWLRLLEPVASYEMRDEAAAETCFGPDQDRIEAIVASQVLFGIRNAVQAAPLSDAADVLSNGWLRDVDGATALQRCGIELGGLDLSRSTLWQVEQVNCAERPDFEACNR